MYMEMNAHIPQSYEATAELQEIASVPQQIIRPRDSTPVIGVVQDALAGAYLATRPGNYFTRREFMNMMMKNKRFQDVPAPRVEGRYTGQQMIETLLAPINMVTPNSMYKADKQDFNMVKIREGNFEQGVLDKGIFNKAGHGILHTTYNDYGPQAAVELLDGLQNMMETYLIMKGFSVGVSDLIADEETRKQMEDAITAKKKEVDDLMLQVHTDLFTNNSGKSNQEEFEARAVGILNKATGDAGKIGVASLSAENRLMTMVRSGSKGDENNVAQMIACLGQVSVEGKRIPYGFTDRTLPHYKMYDDGVQARGFVESSFMRGLTPQEFFFHAMAGREGLIDTAVKSVTGDTPIVIIEGGKAKRVRIGDWIDAHLDARMESVEYFPKDNNLEILQLDEETYIPSVDEDGKVMWASVAAVTRHDPGVQLYEIKTLGGRSVIVTAAKSLLVWQPDTRKFVHMNTPDVRPGQFVPVTMNLETPPVVTKSIPLENYLPKTKYIYGTDFEIARKAVTEAAIEYEKVPAGWWAERNGRDFVLPYENKGRFVRTLVRSKTDNIVPGCVYPFSTNREHIRIPDTFELNKENGIFLGLFLAEGNVDVKSGYIQITNNNASVREFVSEWFESMRLCITEQVKINHIGGISTSVRGYSTLLAKFLDKLVGHGAENKRVPSEAFTAPEEFVCGLLAGYFSGDGTVTNTSVEASSASKELIDGIAMLCSRIGVFAKVFQSQLTSNNLGTETILPTYRISIRAQWASQFAKCVDMVDDEKQSKLEKLKPTSSHRNFSSQNDVVLDEIVEINPVGVEKYPKMYDLTVPNTFTFGLANGLQVYDTAETGYTQRQLIKAMEDLVTQHDGSVRDGGGRIIQFRYGEDGVNSTKLEGSELPLEKLTEQEIRNEFGMKNVDLAQILQPGITRGDDSEVLEEYTADILRDRKMLVEGVFGSARAFSLNTPLNLQRILLNTKIKFNLDTKKQTDLTPLQVLEDIRKLSERTQPYNKIWIASLRFHLAPHKIIVKERFTVEAWSTLVEMICIKNWKSWAVPGELVGIVAAQSIGEPATQMSCRFTTEIVVKTGKNSVYKGAIGPFIDELLEKHKKDVVTIGEDSVVLDLADDTEIVGVSENEKVSWRRISQISRHPANGGLVEVHTRSGRKTTATLSHSFLRRSTTGIVPVLGSELKVGMRIPVAKHIPTVADPVQFMKQGDTTFVLDKDFGWLCGLYLADGSMNGKVVRISKLAPIIETTLQNICDEYGWKLTTEHYKGEYGPGKDNNIHSKDLRDFLVKHFGQGSYTKEVGGFVFGASQEFICGVIGGYFDGDGNVHAERQMIRAGSRSEKLIKDMAKLLGHCSMFATLHQEKKTSQPDKTMYTLHISRKYAKQYAEMIGFVMEEKRAALDAVIKYNDRDDAHNQQEMIDKIPELGGVIAQTGKLLRMPGQSRTYGRWTKKESIGRRTLTEYVEQFKEMMNVYVDPIVKEQVEKNIAIMESALAADVVWDEIVDLVYLDDPKEYVYDFTVPGNDSFMVDESILVHNTLNTFHQAGVAAKSAMTRGVPRLKELLKVTKKPKATSLTITLKPAFRNNKDDVRKVTQDLELTLLKDIVRKAAIYYDPDDDNSVIEEDRDVIKFFKAMEMRNGSGSCGPGGLTSDEQGQKEAYSKWVIRFEFDREKMFNKNITMDDVYFVIQNVYDFYGDKDENIHTIYSDYNSSKLVMRIRPREGDSLYGDDLASIKKFQNTMLQNTVIRGVPGIRAVTWRKDDNRVELENGEYKKVGQYLLDTDGSNFVSVLTHPSVDGEKLYSTNVHDIYEELGIEATRATLYSELNGLFDDAGINYRHLGLLCDIMTHGGRLMSADRYGINKRDVEPLAKASFEETEQILLKAALFGEMDPVTGVSANIMTGQPIRAGTTFSQIILDEAALPRLMEGLPAVEEEEDEDEEAPTQEMIDQEIYGVDNSACAQVQTTMNMILPNTDTRIEEDDVELVAIE